MLIPCLYCICCDGVLYEKGLESLLEGNLEEDQQVGLLERLERDKVSIIPVCDHRSHNSCISNWAWSLITKECGLSMTDFQHIDEENILRTKLSCPLCQDKSEFQIKIQEYLKTMFIGTWNTRR